MARSTRHRSIGAALGTALTSLAVAGLVTVAPATVPTASAATPSAQPPVPQSMAALGNSITRGFNACGWYVDCPSRSWSTGSSSSVDSHRLRIEAAAGRSVAAYNDARSGGRVADLAGQARTAVSQGVGYVTILMGANDACTSSEASMTPVSTFETRFRSGMAVLGDGLPNAAIFVASIPDIKRLWEVGRNDPRALAAWEFFDICQSMLANPTSNSAADAARRDRVRQRVVDYNAVLARVCAEYPTCRYDDGAVFGFPFMLSHVSGWDYFHPNTAGQAMLADITYRNGFTW